METKSNPNMTIPHPETEYATLLDNMNQSFNFVDDVIFKKYVSNINQMDVIPLDANSVDNPFLDQIRIFKINEMVYQKDEYATYKFATVFNAAVHMNCSVFVLIDSDGKKTNFYMGIRSLGMERTASSIRDIIENTLVGQFPGVQCENLLNDEAQMLIDGISANSISAVTCVANNKDSQFKENRVFLQGLEKLALSMLGQKYTGIILANGTSASEIDKVRTAYETIYTNISPFVNVQLGYGTNQSISQSHQEGYGQVTGKGNSRTVSETHGKNWSTSKTDSHSTSKDSTTSKVLSGVQAAVGIAGATLAPVTAGASFGIGFLASSVLGAAAVAAKKTYTDGMSEAITKGGQQSKSFTDGTSWHHDYSHNQADTLSHTNGNSKNLQLTVQNKTVMNILERIDMQFKRLQECESTGMWWCAAYFLSENHASAEIAASTYQALMRGKNTGIETSAVNTWDRKENPSFKYVEEYLRNFMHPLFFYKQNVVVTPCALVNSNELAVHMGLPRKSICGFPVIEHANFGKEVVKYNSCSAKNNFVIGNIFSIGNQSDTEVRLDRDFMTMHTFVTGSTGSGKSNTIYKLLEQLCLRRKTDTKFLVIEPAKGEYKDVFGGQTDVEVYGTNPFKAPNLLQINPFYFPNDVHVLEHVDRLVEVFNACWPMYAAMPAILKESVEKAYEECGWNLKTSKSTDIYPTFDTLLSVFPKVVDSSAYSADTSNDYKGALITRIRSLTRGIHGQIFSGEIQSEKIFNNNAIIDISRVGSGETKALIMGILVLKLQEFRMSEHVKHNSGLRHITVLEEAHNLLRRTSSEQSQEGSNLQGKSVEMLANAIAEMRTYGEGFIIADQSPGLMDMSVIRNTNTKIILRLPDESDRTLVGKAAGLNDSQVEELSRLERGVAAISQSDWLEPVLCKIDKFDDEHPLESRYKTADFTWEDDNSIAVQQFFCVVFDVEHIKLAKDVVDKIREWYGGLGLSEKAQFIFEHALEGNVLDNKQKLLLVYYAVDRKLDKIPVRQDAVNEVKHTLSCKYGIAENGEVIRRINELFLLYFPVNTILGDTIEQTERLGKDVRPL